MCFASRRAITEDTGAALRDPFDAPLLERRRSSARLTTTTIVAVRKGGERGAGIILQKGLQAPAEEGYPPFSKTSDTRFWPWSRYWGARRRPDRNYRERLSRSRGDRSRFDRERGERSRFVGRGGDRRR